MLCVAVFLFTLFVVLNLIVINIFDLFVYLTSLSMKKKNCFVWLVLHFEMYLLGSLSSDIFLLHSKTVFQKRKEKKKLKYSFIVPVLRQILC